MRIYKNHTDREEDVRLLHSLVLNLSREAGACDAVIVSKLGECAEARAAIDLLELLQRVARPRFASSKTQAHHVLEAFDEILKALGHYRLGHEKLQGRLLTQLGKLKRARPKDWCGLLHKMTANPDHEPALLSALWHAACDRGALRKRGRAETTTVEVLVGRNWVQEAERWKELLTRETYRFPQIVDQAIASNQPYKHSFDYIRRLRELAKQPTEPRLRNFIRDASAADRNRMDVAGSGFAYAGRYTKIFPDGLPSDWLERVARKPKHIEQLARGFLHLIEPRKETRGRKRDAAIGTFADTVGSAYSQLAGKRISYARGTETSRPGLRGKSYGLGLNVMTAALRLVDSSFGSSQAQAQIDRIQRGSKTVP